MVGSSWGVSSFIILCVGVLDLGKVLFFCCCSVVIFFFIRVFWIELGFSFFCCGVEISLGWLMFRGLVMVEFIVRGFVFLGGVFGRFS